MSANQGSNGSTVDVIQSSVHTHIQPHIQLNPVLINGFGKLNFWYGVQRVVLLINFTVQYSVYYGE